MFSTLNFVAALFSLVVELCKKEPTARKHGPQPKTMEASLPQVLSQESAVLIFSMASREHLCTLLVNTKHPFLFLLLEACVW